MGKEGILQAYTLNGEPKWRAVVDADNDITNEADEGNNEARGAVTAGSGIFYMDGSAI